MVKDQVMMQAPVDLWGLNVINRNTLQTAAAAIVGMAEAAMKIVPVKPMVGVTTRGIMKYLNWIKPAQVNGFYAAGFTNGVAVTGSKYMPVAPVLSLTNGELVFSGVDLATPFTNQVTWQRNNIVTNQSANP